MLLIYRMSLILLLLHQMMLCSCVYILNFGILYKYLGLLYHKDISKVDVLSGFLFARISFPAVIPLVVAIPYHLQYHNDSSIGSSTYCIQYFH